MSRHQPWSEADLEAAKQRMIVRGAGSARTVRGGQSKTSAAGERSVCTPSGMQAKAQVSREQAEATTRTLQNGPSPSMQSFFVPGILPGQNIIVGRATRWLYRKEKKLWEAKALLAIRDAQLSPMARVHITWGWIERNKRRDPDNFTGLSKKFLLDAIVKNGILPDDGWDEIAGWSDGWHVEKDNPGVLVTLEVRP